MPEDSRGFSGQDVTQNTPEQAGRQLRFLPERTRTGSLWKPNVLALLDTHPHTRGLQRKCDPRDDTCYVEERHSGPQRQPQQHPGTPARARAPRDQLSTQPRTRGGRTSSSPAGRARGLATWTAQRPLENFSDMAQRELGAGWGGGTFTNKSPRASETQSPHSGVAASREAGPEATCRPCVEPGRRVPVPYFPSAPNSHNRPAGPRGPRGTHVRGPISPSLLPPPRASLCLYPGCASPTCPRCTTGQLGDHALTSKGAVLTPFACGAQRAQGRQRAQGPGRVTDQQSRLPWGPWDTNLCASPPLPASSCSAGAEQKTACASRLRPCSAQTCQGTGKPQGPPQAKQVPLRAAGAAVGGDAGTRRQLP